MRNTETLDKLYLEWSQFTGARTERENFAQSVLRLIEKKINSPEQDLDILNDQIRLALEKLGS